MDDGYACNWKRNPVSRDYGRILDTSTGEKVYFAKHVTDKFSTFCMRGTGRIDQYSDDVDTCA